MFFKTRSVRDLLKDGRTPKNLLFGELASGKRETGRPSSHFEDVCKLDLRKGGFNLADPRTPASDRQKWHATTRQITNAAKERRNARREEKTTKEKKNIQPQPHPRQPSDVRLVADPAPITSDSLSH